jgi:hypothetical protein
VITVTDRPQIAGIDREQLRVLLKCYWRLSVRGRVARSMGRAEKPRSLLFVIGMYMFMGLMTGIAVLSIRLDVFTYSILVHSITFFVVGMAVTSESGDILFNTNESDVLVHRPIHPRTLLLAKSINLIAFTLILAGALNLFPIFFGLAASGARVWFPIVHLFSMILLCVFCAAAVVCTYGLVIKFLDREKFDNFAAWSQVGMSILFIGGYQVVPRLLNRFEDLSLAPYARYLFPLPPAWFAGIDSWVAGDRLVSGALLGGVGLVTTAALSYLAIGKLAPSYGEGLTRLSESRSRTSKPAKVSRPSTSIRNPILRWWLRDPVEQWAFRLAGAYMRRDRDIKLRLYPSLTIFLIFPLMNLLDRNRHGFSAFLPLLTVWVLGMLPHQAMQTLQMSQDHLAADIFAIAPLPSAAPVFHGIRKATIYYLLIPALCIAAILIGYLAPGGGQGLLLAFPGVVALPVLSLVPAVTQEYLPLSRPVTRGEQSSRNVSLMFMTMIVMAGVLVVSYLAWASGLIWYLVAIEGVIAIVLYQYLNRMIRNRPLVRTYNDLFSYGSERGSK